MKSMFIPLTRYAQFTGRAGRKEYWMYQLFLAIVGIVLYAGIGVGAAMESNAITILFAVLLGVFWLAVCVPSVAVSIRRMHDTNKSGWYVLVSLIPFVGGIIFLVLCVLPGDLGENNFGPVPAAI